MDQRIGEWGNVGIKHTKSKLAAKGRDEAHNRPKAVEVRYHQVDGVETVQDSRDQQHPKTHSHAGDVCGW